MTTEYGKTVRKLRIDKLMSLKELAEKLGVTPSYISAVEMGRKKLTDELVESVSDAMELSRSERELVWVAAVESRDHVTIDVRNADSSAREAVAVLARNFGELSPEALKSIRQLADVK